MTKTVSWLTGLALALLLVTSCGTEDPPCCEDETATYGDLTRSDHALFNLELAYDSRNAVEMTRLLDPNFTFYFGAGDVLSGGTPEKWGREAEMEATDNLFDPQYAGNAVRSIDLHIVADPAGWKQTAPLDTLLFPGETWLTQTVHYSLQLEVEPDITYLITDLQARITIRTSMFEGATKWRIVEWRDDVGGGAADRSVAAPGGATIEDATWGRLKALYQDGPIYQSLTEPDDVLENLELSWDQRNLDEYAQLLDDPGFVFIFSLADFASGRTPDQWGRSAELTAVGNMFDPNYAGNNRVVNIDIDLQYLEGNWTEITPPAPLVPGEKWLVKQVTYSMVVQALPDITFISSDVKAEFTIRAAEDGDRHNWRIIVWRDQVENKVVSTGPRSPAVEESTWGSIKSLYAELAR